MRNLGKVFKKVTFFLNVYQFLKDDNTEFFSEIRKFIRKGRFEQLIALLVHQFMLAISKGVIPVNEVNFAKVYRRIQECILLVRKQLEYFKTEGEFDDVALHALSAWAGGKPTPAEYVRKYRVGNADASKKNSEPEVGEAKPEIAEGFILLIDAGHGGIGKDGLYTTAPSKMFKHPEFTFYEGVFNRKVANKLEWMCHEAGIPTQNIHSGVDDTPLSERVHWTDKFSKKFPKAVLMSIHGNAAGNQNATGIEVFTSPGETMSDRIATVLLSKLEAQLPGMKFRKDHTDGDPDKEAGFYMLTRTRCPAVLSENGFFTNPEEARLMLTDEFQEKVAKAHFETVLEIQKFL